MNDEYDVPVIDEDALLSITRQDRPETVEEYLARGGRIQHIPFGQCTIYEGIDTRTEEQKQADHERWKRTQRRNPIPPYSRATDEHQWRQG